MRLPFNGDYRITQPFGVNPQDYAQFGMAGHNGIDYGLPSGTPVIAAESGRVSALEDPQGFGHYVELVGAHKTIYAHLSAFSVPTGTVVQEGQQIGVSGSTGNSSGPHLHFGVKPLSQNSNNGYFGAVDPQAFFNQGEPDVIPDEDHLQALFRAFRGRPAGPEEVKKYVGTSYSGMVEALDQGPERAGVANALAAYADAKAWKDKATAPGAIIVQKADYDDAHAWKSKAAELQQQLDQLGSEAMELKPGRYLVK